MKAFALFVSLIVVNFNMAQAKNTCASILVEEATKAEVTSDLEQLLSMIGPGSTNLKTDMFQNFSKNITEKLSELKVQVEKVGDESLKGDFNTLVLRTLLFNNVDNRQIGFLKKPEKSSIITIFDAMNLIIPSNQENHYAYLLMEFFALIDTEPQKLHEVLAQVSTPSQFEAMFLSLGLGLQNEELFARVLEMDNSYQSEAFKASVQFIQPNEQIMQAIIGITSEAQLKVFKTALQHQVESADLYFEIIPEIESSSEAADVIKKIKAKIIN